MTKMLAAAVLSLRFLATLFFLRRQSKDFSVKRMIEKYRSRVLYCDSILQHNSFIAPIPSSKKKTKAGQRQTSSSSSKNSRFEVGCSYNPPFEAHQDALAVAVVEEMQKVYKKELEPTPLPSFVTGDPVLEEDKFFLDVDDETDPNLDANNDECDLENQGPRPLKIRKLTQAELKRKARRQEQFKIEAAKKKLRRAVAALKEYGRPLPHGIKNQNPCY